MELSASESLVVKQNLDLDTPKDLVVESASASASVDPVEANLADTNILRESSLANGGIGETPVGVSAFTASVKLDFYNLW